VVVSGAIVSSPLCTPQQLVRPGRILWDLKCDRYAAPSVPSETPASLARLRSAAAFIARLRHDHQIVVALVVEHRARIVGSIRVVRSASSPRRRRGYRDFDSVKPAWRRPYQPARHPLLTPRSRNRPTAGVRAQTVPPDCKAARKCAAAAAPEIQRAAVAHLDSRHYPGVALCALNPVTCRSRFRGYVCFVFHRITS